MHIQIPVNHKNLSLILHITDATYYKGRKATLIDPPEYPEVDVLDGYVELDGEVFDIVDITSSDMDVIMAIDAQDDDLFYELCNANTDAVSEEVARYCQEQEDDARIVAFEYYNER